MEANSKTFVVYMAIKELEKMPVHLKIHAQVKALIFDEAFTAIPIEYSNYSEFFSLENAAKLPEYIKINDHAIKLEKDKQPSFGPIYSLKQVDLETLKTYIETNLANDFIWASKSPTKTLIFFN